MPPARRRPLPGAPAASPSRFRSSGASVSLCRAPTRPRPKLPCIPFPPACGPRPATAKGRAAHGAQAVLNVKIIGSRRQGVLHQLFLVQGKLHQLARCWPGPPVVQALELGLELAQGKWGAALGFQGGLDVHDTGGTVPETHLAALFVLAQVAGDGLGVTVPGLEGELDLLETAVSLPEAAGESSGACCRHLGHVVRLPGRQ